MSRHLIVAAVAALRTLPVLALAVCSRFAHPPLLLLTLLFLLVPGCARDASIDRGVEQKADAIDKSDPNAWIQAVDFAERHGGGRTELPSGKRFRRVDAFSEIEIKPKREVLQQLAAKIQPAPRVLTPLTAAERRRREALVGLASEIARFKQFHADALNRRSPQERLEMQAEFDPSSLQNAYDEVLRARAAAEGRAVSETPTNLFAENRTLARPEAIRQTLSEEIRNYNREVAEDQVKAEAGSKLVVNISAWLQGTASSVAIHVEGYDDIKERHVAKPYYYVRQKLDPQDEAKKKEAEDQGKKVAESVQQIRSAEKEIAQKLSSVRSALRESAVANKQQQLEVLEKVATPVEPQADPQPPRQIDQDATDPPAGSIDLSETPADVGDFIAVQVSLSRPEETTTNPDGTTTTTRPRQLIGSKPFKFRVDRYDLSYTVSGNLIFVNRFGNEEEANDFVPAPAASVTLHLRPRGITPDWWDGLLREIDPGVGLNLAALNFDDELGIGVGVQGTFMRDIIQVGYGYNIMANEEPQYWWFGIGLLETLNKIGELTRASVDDFKSKAK